MVGALGGQPVVGDYFCTATTLTCYSTLNAKKMYALGASLDPQGQ